MHWYLHLSQGVVPTCFLLLGGGLGISAQQDGSPEPLVELLLCAQKARHQEVKQRPQLQNIVLIKGRPSEIILYKTVLSQQTDLYRGAREDESVVGANLFDGLCDLRHTKCAMLKTIMQ